MNIIKCPECHEEILILPNLIMVRNAIDKHLAKREIELMSLPAKNTPLIEFQTDLALTKIKFSLDGQVLRLIGNSNVESERRTDR